MKKILVHKVELFVLDFEGYGAEGLKVELERNKYYYPRILHIETKQMDRPETDDFPLNYEVTKDQFQEIFDQLEPIDGNALISGS
ncbi:hypothetical protein D3C87_279070 [compost metagenome]